MEQAASPGSCEQEPGDHQEYCCFGMTRLHLGHRGVTPWKRSTPGTPGSGSVLTLLTLAGSACPVIRQRIRRNMPRTRQHPSYTAMGCQS